MSNFLSFGFDFTFKESIVQDSINAMRMSSPCFEE